MELDLFFLWRRVLVIACFVYAAVRLAQFLIRWYRNLSGQGRYISLARSYVLLHMLRISPRRFAWEIVDIVLLAGVATTLIWLHWHVG